MRAVRGVVTQGRCYDFGGSGARAVYAVQPVVGLLLTSDLLGVLKVGSHREGPSALHYIELTFRDKTLRKKTRERNTFSVSACLCNSVAFEPLGVVLDFTALAPDPIVLIKQTGFQSSAASCCSNRHEISELKTLQSSMASRLALHSKRIEQHAHRFQANNTVSVT